MKITSTDNINLGQKENEIKMDKKSFFKCFLSFNKGCLIFFIVILCLFSGLFYWFNSSNEISVSTNQRIDITHTQIQQIQDIGQWEFLAINDEELIDTVSRGFFSDSELVRIYYGTLRLGIDLHQTEPHWIRVENDSVIVAKLPPIVLLDTNFIDEAKSRSFFEKGDWTSADREQLYNRAYKKMIARCMTKENIMIAERNAKQQFVQFLHSMGYKNIKVEFMPRKNKKLSP